MSGGSYNYLCWETESLGGRRSDLESMAQRLEGLPWAGHAATATRQLIRLLDQVEKEGRALSDVWHAIEWWDSGDWGAAGAREVVEPWRPEESVNYVGPDPQAIYRLVDVGGGIFELRSVMRDNRASSEGVTNE